MTTNFIIYFDRGMNMPQLRRDKKPLPWVTHPYWIQYLNDSPIDFNLPESELTIWDYRRSEFIAKKGLKK